MKRMGFIFLLILSFQVISYAQDTAELPDISQNFTDYMTLVDVRDLPPPVTTQVHNTHPTYDDATREIRIYDDETDTWLTLPYPEGVDHVRGAGWYPNGLFVVNTIRNRGAYSMGVDPSGDWVLDLETGEYTRPELLCGEWRAEAGQGIWVGYQLEDEGVLCHTETGEQISLGFDDIRGVYPSPNDETVAMFAYDGVYTYTFATEELIRVGQTHSYDFESIYWLGNEWLMIRQTMMADMSFPWIFYSLANAFVADSMEQVTYVLKPGDLDLLDNPRRYEWIDVDANGEDCLLVQMRVSDGHRDEFNIGDICSRGTVLGDSDERLATMMITEDSEWEGHPHPIGQQIMRFNPYTGEQRTLLEGEIESLYDITFDNHYAVLVIDDSGQIDMLTDEERQFYFYDHERDTLNFRYVIFDLFHETIVYETPVTTAHYLDYWYDDFDTESGDIRLKGLVVSYLVAPVDSMFYIGNDTFILGREGENWQSTYSIIHIGMEIVERPIGTPLLLMGDGRHLITARTEGNNSSFLVYDTESGEETIILNIEAQFEQDYFRYKLGHDNRYILSFTRGVAADTLVVSVWDTETQGSREYLLQLPDEN